MKKLYNITSFLAPSVPLSVKRIFYTVWTFWIDRHNDAEVNKDPVLILGNHKAGTTVIAVLLAEISGLSVATGIKKQMLKPLYDRVRNGEIDFSEFVDTNKKDFSKDILKENQLTFLYEELLKYFSKPKFIFVIRDPRDNIRSILNRMNIPGNLDDIKPQHIKNISPAQKLVINNRWLGIDSGNYIEILAARWKLASEVYLKNAENMILIRYEDFNENKVEEISHLAKKLSYPLINDISSLVDIQYQPRGDREVIWEEFFGYKNLKKIETICDESMKRFTYQV
ncbi:sulfotransferase domain-containing protein [Thermodesulfobacteriota bacterium]